MTSLAANTPVGRLAVLVFVAILAGAAGIVVGLVGWQAVVVIISSLALLILTYKGPFAILAVEFCVGSFFVGRIVNLGALPDLSLERVLLPLASIVLVTQWLTHKRQFPKIDFEDWLLLLFLVWGGISVFLLNQTPLSLQLQDFSSYFIPICAYFILKFTLETESQLKFIMRAAVVLLIVISVGAPLEEVTGMSVLGRATEHVTGILRVQSFFRSAWEFVTIAGMFLGLAIYSLGAYASRTWRRLAGFAILAGSLAMALTFMRAGWIGWLAVAIILLWQWPRLRSYAWILAVIVILLAILYLPVLANSEVWTGRIAQVGNIIGREALLRAQWSAFVQNPVLGVGLGHLTTGYLISPAFDVMSHNAYLSHLVGLGLLGSTYFAAIIVILVESIATYRRLPRGVNIGQELIAALWAAAAVFLIAAATFETRLFIYMNVLFWIVLGLLSSVRSRISMQ